MGKEAMAAILPLGRFLWERIRQIGVETIFGVPGDFNLQFLDYIYEVDGLKFVGNQNELNAAYTADGYARIKGAPGVVVTTHGVGELSALNGVAGALSERVKLIHVVGQTTRAMQKNRMMIHHSIGNNPNHQQYNDVAKGLRVDAAELWDVNTAPAEIDRVIREYVIQSGPVYIFLTLDLSAEHVPASLLDTPLNLSPGIDSPAQENAVAAIKDALLSAKNPCLFVDALVHHFNASDEVNDLVRKLAVRFYAANMGKGIVNESDPMYVGLYNGAINSPGVEAAWLESDLTVLLGYIPSDTNSGGFSRKVDPQTTTEINPFNVVVKGQEYPNTFMKPLLTALSESLGTTYPCGQFDVSPAKLPPPHPSRDLDADHITHSWLWPQIEKFLQPGDVLMGETGTALFGIVDIKFPKNIRWHTQTYYSSIGWATAVTLGAEVARRELYGDSGRTILITGDGSMAMTIQEVSTMVKVGIKPVLIVLNNSGYTVERMIWGARQPYNDIPPTNYAHLLPLYHHPLPETSFHRAELKAELSQVFAKPALKKPEYLQLVEIVLDSRDTSWRLGAQLAFRSKGHQEYLKNEGFVDAVGGWGLDKGRNEGGRDFKWA